LPVVYVTAKGALYGLDVGVKAVAADLGPVDDARPQVPAEGESMRTVSLADDVADDRLAVRVEPKEGVAVAEVCAVAWPEPSLLRC
jgi:hypothetical protein